jgi:biopolymer transport protein ExbD
MKIVKRKSAKSTIPVASMADIAFLLLIFFMISSIGEVDKEFPLKLPEARMTIQEKKKYFNVWITPEGNYYFGGKQGTLTALTTFAQYSIVSNPETRALIRAEQAVPYEYVNSVIDSLKDAGVRNVILVSTKKK